MADRFTAWVGIVAFPFNPEKDQRTVSGRTVRKFTLNVDNYEETVQIDLWPDYEGIPNLQQGDIVICGGKASTFEWDQQLENGETRHRVRWQMSPYSIQINGGEIHRSSKPEVKSANSGTPSVKRKTF